MELRGINVANAINEELIAELEAIKAADASARTLILL